MCDFTDTDTDQLLMINIDGSSDPHYRYKMPPVKVEHINSKGGMTKMYNANQVCKAIYRSLKDLKAYYSRKLGNQVKIKDNHLIFKGVINDDLLQTLLHEYITKYVLCRKCNSPETINNKCQACGYLVVK